MEDVLAIYHMRYDATRPVVCMDETSKQLTMETRTPQLAIPGSPARYDFEYARNGVAQLFMFFEPLAGKRTVSVRPRKRAVDWGEEIKELLDKRYPNAEKVVLVMDNLNTHDTGSLYEAFPPAEARRLANRLEIHHTPKHGSWLNVAEIELSALGRQCLGERIPDERSMQRLVKAWAEERNNKKVKVDWQFTTENARVKLKSLYPKV